MGWCTQVLQYLTATLALSSFRLRHPTPDADELPIDVLHTSSGRVHDSFLNLFFDEGSSERLEGLVQAIMLHVLNEEFQLRESRV